MMSRSKTFPSLSSSRQMMMAWKVSGLSHRPAIIRWFYGLSIEDKIPDHSAFSRTRHERFRDSDMFRRMFDRVVEACIAAGLVGGEGFAVDASLIAADANKQRS